MKKRQIYVLTYFAIVEAYVFCIPLPARGPLNSVPNLMKSWLTEDRLSLASGVAIVFFLIFLAATFSEQWAAKARAKHKKTSAK
jgi:hypothetical protein